MPERGTPGQDSNRTPFHSVSLAAGAGVALAGAFFLIEWLGGGMAQRGFSAITIKTNAALGLLLSGVALLLIAPPETGRGRRLAGRLCAGLVLLTGALTFAENLFGWDLGIDQLLAEEPPGALGVENPNRMGVPASLSYTLAGTALLLLAGRRARGAVAAQWLGILIVGVGLLGTIGYLYGAEPLFGIARFTAIAPSTALALLALGFGLLFARPDQGPVTVLTARRPGARVVRLLLLASVVLPVLLGYVRLLGERADHYDAPLGTALLVLAFIVVFSALVALAARWLGRVARETEERHQAEERLRRIEWLLRGSGEHELGPTTESDGPADGPDGMEGGPGPIRRAVGEPTLRGIATDYLDLLGTATVIHERDGRQAVGLFAEGWCQFLVSTEEAGPPEPAPGDAGPAPPRCTSCWDAVSRRAMAERRPVDTACAIGLRLYAVPIVAGDEVVGSIGFGYGDPPQDLTRLAALSAHSGVPVATLAQRAAAYETRPPFVIDVARRRLLTSARLIGEIVERRAAEDALRASEARLLEAVAETERSRAQLAAVFQSVSDGIIVYGPDGDVLLANDATARMIGYDDVRELLRDFDRLRDVLEARHPDGRPLPFEEWPRTRVLRGESVVDCELLVRRTDTGQEWIFSFAAEPVRNDRGEQILSVVTCRDVTDRRRAAAALEESRARLKAILDNLNDGVIVVDPSGAVRDVNPAGLRLHGYRDLEEALRGLSSQADHKEFRSLAGVPLAPEDWPLARVLRGETFTNLLVEVRDRASGGAWFGSYSGTAVRGAAGELLLSVLTVRDETDRIAAERALAASEARLRATFHHAGVGIVEVDRHDDRFIAANDRALEVLGYRREELLGRTVHDVTWPEDRALSDEVNARIHDGRRDRIEYEKRYLRGDGTPVWVRATVSAVRDAAGRWLRSITTVEDISQRKAAEDALRESEERFRTLADNITQLAWMTDETGHIFWYNRRWFEYTGTTLDQVKGWGWQRVHHPDHVERVVASIRHSFATGEPWEDTFPLRGRDGSWRWFLSRAVAVRDEDGRIVRWFGTNTDITERKAAEEALFDLKESLEQRVAARTAEAEQRAAQLRALALELTQTERRERTRLAKLLHDHLQQLLVAARMRAGLVERRVTDEGLRKSATEAAHLLDEAITASRTLTAELSPLVLQDRGLVAGLEWLARWMGEKHGLRVEFALDPAAEPADEAVRLTLFEAARELLLNVVKHAGTDRARVQVDPDGGRAVQITVEDAGRGFDPTQVARGPDASGGFGLFSLRERLTWLGGQLTVVSVPGSGTRVTVRVPTPLSELPATAGGQPPPPARPGGPIRVLLVDDHAMVRQGIATMLGFEPDIQVVGEAANGRDAVELARRLRPDVVVMDVTMPVMDGLEATRRITAEVPAARVIGLSLHDSGDMARAMRDAGAAAYLSKAGPSDRLVDQIRAVTGAAAPDDGLAGPAAAGLTE